MNSPITNLPDKSNEKASDTQNYENWAVDDWKSWVDQEKTKSQEASAIKPEVMIGEYRRERAKKEEYNGRQILELLQNADDENKAGTKSRVLIKLLGNQLIVANTGRPFSPLGISSLMNADNSPKVTKSKQIGYKGLGFRSILSWTSSVIIASRALCVEFSRDYAKAFFEDFAQKNKDTAQEIRKRANEQYPIATLSVPQIVEKPSFVNGEYDTYIIINFEDKEVYKDILEQINGLGKEILLFLNNIDQLVIETNLRKKVIQREIESDSVTITIEDSDTNEKDTKTWKVFAKSGQLPKKLRLGEQEKQFNYELKIAVSPELDDDVNRLFSFFRTDVVFPFPAIIHGTFKLDSSRNHLVKDKINEYLLKELSELMIGTALAIKHDKDDFWQPLKLLSGITQVTEPKLVEMGLEEIFIENIKKAQIIPTVLGRYISVEDQPKFYSSPFAEILVFDIFDDLVKYTNEDSIKQLLKKLNVGTYTVHEFIRRINKISDKLSIEQCARLIKLICETKYNIFSYVNKEHMPSLLVDSYDRIIDSKAKALFPPESKSFQLPSEINLRLVKQGLVSELKRVFGVQRIRDVITKINCFNIQEYAFTPVVSKIVAQSNRLQKKAVKNKDIIFKNMIQALFSIYKTNPDEKFPTEKVSVPLKNVKGDTVSAKELYLSNRYLSGEVMHNLFFDIDSSVFVSNPSHLGLDAETLQEVEAFLIWLGVAVYPRIEFIKIKNIDVAYSKYHAEILKNLNFPLYLQGELVYIEGDTEIDSLESLNNLTREFNANLQTIPLLDKILDNSKFEDILVWILSDNRLREMIEKDKEINSKSTYGFLFRKKVDERTLIGDEIPSFILWQLSNKGWITTKNGKKTIPIYCSLSKIFGDTDLSPIIEIPDINYQYKYFLQNKITLEDIDYILSKIGVTREISNMPTDTLYSILLKMPEVDPEGKKAKAFYRRIIDNKKNLDIDQNSESFKEFMKNGLLLGKQNGNLSYFPVSGLSYIENLTFSKEMIDLFPILEIDKRVGAKNVKEIFGVHSFNPKIKVKNHEEHPFNDTFQKELQYLKPYIYAYRITVDHKHANLNALKRLKITLCKDITGSYLFKEQEKPLTVTNLGFINLKGNKVILYIDPSESYSSFDDLKSDVDFRDAIADIISTALKVQDNRDKVRMLLASKPSDRDKIVNNDLGEGNIMLSQAKRLLGAILNKKREFWETISSLLKTPFEILPDLQEDELKSLVSSSISVDADVIDKIDYDNLSNPTNIFLIKKLFDNLNITIEQFNQASIFKIDFTNYYNQALQKLTMSLSENFKNLVHKFLVSKNESEQKSFIRQLQSFDEIRILDSQKNILETDVTKILDAILTKNFTDFTVSCDLLNAVKDLDLEKDYRESQKKLSDRLRKEGASSDDLEQFMQRDDVISLLYFKQVEILANNFYSIYGKPQPKTGNANTTNKKSIDINGTEVEYDSDNYDSIKDLIEKDIEDNDYSLQEGKSKKITKLKLTANKKGHACTGSPKKKNTEENGFIGEYYVYNVLVNKYGKEKVWWVSGNAKKAKVNLKGDDSLGYDIKYIDENNVLHYVEVKSVSDDTLIASISRNEVLFGEKNKDNYDIIFVTNVRDKSKDIILFKNIFKFDEVYSFIDNNTFSVENESYRIRFNLENN